MTPHPLAPVTQHLGPCTLLSTCPRPLLFLLLAIVLMRTFYASQAPFLSPSKEIIRSLRISIIGGGVAGLSAALALRKYGFQRVEIYEGATTLREVGAGIQCAPNMARILSSLGVLEDLRPYAVSLSGISLRRELMQPPLVSDSESSQVGRMIPSSAGPPQCLDRNPRMVSHLGCCTVPICNTYS